MIPDVPAAVLASVRSTSDRPIPHPRQEPTMTAPRPSPAGLSPLLDQLDEARATGTPGEWRIPHPFTKLIDGPERQIASAESAADAALIVAAVNALPKLTAAVRGVLALADELEGYTRRRGRPAEGSYDYGVNLAQADAAASIRSALTAALTPGADTAGATA